MAGIITIANIAIQHEMASISSAAKPLLAVSLGDAPLKVELARTLRQRTIGLSGRAGIPDGTGMLFIHDTDGRYSYWMPDMLFSLDILWISAAMKVVHIEHNVTPDSYPDSYTSDVPARYILEVPAGFSEKNNVAIGDTLYLR